jgi:molybdopterin-guanine dinucleotide biosynthesis protein A
MRRPARGGAWVSTPFLSMNSMGERSALPLGAILAGGRNLRYGALKAFAPVAGRAIIQRVLDAVHAVVPDVILIANDPVAYGELGLSMRGDRVRGLGAIGGLHTALHWARDEERPGIVAVACDMPFVSSALLGRLIDRAHELPAADVVVPESDSWRGLEPLCAYYSTRCLPAIERAVTRGDARMIGFHDEVNVARLSLDEVRTFGDPATLFLNVNTPDELERAEQIARETGA